VRKHRTCVVGPSSGWQKEVMLSCSDDVAGRHMTTCMSARSHFRCERRTRRIRERASSAAPLANTSSTSSNLTAPRTSCRIYIVQKFKSTKGININLPPEP
jgi:hypothetical protein